MDYDVDPVSDAERKSSPISTRTQPMVESKRPIGLRHVLMVWTGDEVRSSKLPASGEVTVGRSPDTGVWIDAPTVSRQHARLILEPGAVRVEDLNSQNGTRVNGERLLSARALLYGDVITFGDVTTVLAEDLGAEPVAESPAPRSIDLGDRNVLVADPAMVHTYTQLERLAPSDLSVLISGETGSGKELAAAALRFWSRRSDKPLVTINCAALPDTLAESELFGYERGAFSGAAVAKPGLFESAPGGTVFLDEIGDLSLVIQAKLLRVLEARRVTRLGSVTERPIDIRLIAATHRDLAADVKAGRFREDLYYRLSVAVVRLPPLRARPRELPLLARRFLSDAARGLGKAPLTLTEGALQRLRAHTFPGNVRELKNLMDFLAATVVGTQILAEHLRFGEEAAAPVVAVTAPEAGVRPLAEANREFERQSIVAALAAAGGNKTKAAKLLDVPLRTLMDKIKRHGL
jgi:two-component system response regulator AtoC